MKTKALAAVLAIAVVFVAWEAAMKLVLMPEGLRGEPIGSSEFVDRDGRPLRTMLVDERRYQRRVVLESISPHVLAATVCAEDKRFFSHPGFDLIAICRAAVRWAHGERSGASTITQQLVKISEPAHGQEEQSDLLEKRQGHPGPAGAPTQEGLSVPHSSKTSLARSPFTKLKEIVHALRVEHEWSKPHILEEYLNRLDYGHLQTGIASASRFYFGKVPSDLSVAEAAFLAGLPNAPTRLDPRKNLTGAKARQREILRRMAQAGAIDAATRAQAEAEPLGLIPPRQDFEAPHFVDLLLQRRGLLPKNGGRIVTSLDLELNRRGAEILNVQLAKIADKNASSAAMVVIDNPTGEVLALAGSGNYFEAGDGQINGAWSARSPGSAVKPFAYILALEAGAFPGTVVADVPTDFQTSTGLYSPNNYNHRFYGPVSLRFALGNSLNVAAIRVLGLGGGPSELHRLLGALGITTLTFPPEHYGPGLVLGNGEVRLLELANAFACIARGGIFRPFRLMKESPAAAKSDRRIFSEQSAWLVSDMLADNAARASSFGLHSFLTFPFPAACKTGTSSSYRDNWAFGFTPEFTVAVWVGNPDGSPMHEITGVTGAAPAMHEMLVHLHERFGTTWNKRPSGMQEIFIHPLLGRTVQPDFPGGGNEKCVHLPEPVSAADFDELGRVVLSPEYAAWASDPHCSLNGLVSVPKGKRPLQILQPSPGTVYFLDPDLPDDRQRITLESNSAGPVEWSSPDLEFPAPAQSTKVRLRDGIHTITAHDPSNGQSASTWIEVKQL